MTVSTDRQCGAGQDGLAVHQDSAKATVGGIAAPLYGQATLFPEEVQQNSICFHAGADNPAVEFQFHFHITYLPVRSWSVPPVP